MQGERNAYILSHNHRVIIRDARGRSQPEDARKNWHALDPDSTREDLMAEGEEVSQMIDYGSVVPERENLTYYVIQMQWYHRWQKYTGCYKYEEEEEGSADRRGATPGMNKKDKSKLILGQYPGEIYPIQELKSLMVDTRYKVLTNEKDFDGGFYIKNGKKEN